MCLDNLEELRKHVDSMVTIRDEQKLIVDQPGEATALRKITNYEYTLLLCLRLAQSSYSAEKLGFSQPEPDRPESADDRIIDNRGEVAGGNGSARAESSA